MPMGPIPVVANKGDSMAVRYDWYQTDFNAIIEIFVKNIDGDSVKVDFLHNSVTVEFNASTTPHYERTFLLAGEIIPEECSYHVSHIKLEITLRKAIHGGGWKTLEYSTKESTDEGLAYPSSSRTRHDWQKLDKSAQAAEEGPETPDAFFKQLYADASEETRRAMIKSFVESGGTVLSTNWAEVGTKRVEPALPEGVDPNNS